MNTNRRAFLEAIGAYPERRQHEVYRCESQMGSRKIYTLDPGPAYRDLMTDSVTELEKYDPYKYYAENRAHLDAFSTDSIVEQSRHPGWVDYSVYRLGDYGPNARNFIVTRTVDVEEH